jgi:hypothetical protein
VSTGGDDGGVITPATYTEAGQSVDHAPEDQLEGSD